jgi:hypothetical protein
MQIKQGCMLLVTSYTILLACIHTTRWRKTMSLMLLKDFGFGRTFVENNPAEKRPPSPTMKIEFPTLAGTLPK